MIICVNTMTTLSTSKRIHDLRKRNRNLLKKLETKSSEIHAELKKLQESTRELQPENVARVEKHSETLISKNGSKQVVDSHVLTDSKRFKDMDSSHQLAMITEEVSLKKNISETSDGSTTLSPKCECALNHSEDRWVKKIIESNREMLNSIDYSPKSVFLRRMKSKYLSQCCCEKNEDKRKAKLTIDLESAASLSSSLNKEESVSLCGSSVPGKPSTSRQEGIDFGRLKKFRSLNWSDCHAENEENLFEDEVVWQQDPLPLSSARDKRREMYRINERLFAEPTGLICNNPAKCHLCCGRSTKTCQCSPKKVVVSIPSTLLDISNSSADEKDKKTKRRDSSLKILTKRPKPTNSMALRYQKGIV